MTLADLLQTGVKSHEKFVADSHAMDVAFLDGTLVAWVASQIDKEFANGGSDGPTAEGSR